MLQKVDKDRLAKVLMLMEKCGIRKANSVIVKEFDEDAGNVSNYMRGKKPFPDELYTKIVQKWEGPTINKPIESEGNEQSIYFLAASNNNLSIAQKDIAASNLRLTELLEKATGKFNSVAYPSSAASQLPSLDKLASALADKFALTQEEVAVELGRLFYAHQFLEKV